jgi:hypothetical protein
MSTSARDIDCGATSTDSLRDKKGEGSGTGATGTGATGTGAGAGATFAVWSFFASPPRYDIYLVCGERICDNILQVLEVGI